MKTKITNAIKAVCIASFCASALSQTIKETDPSNKKVDIFICNVHKGSHFLPNEDINNVDVPDCRNINKTGANFFAIGVCLTERVEISKLQ